MPLLEKLKRLLRRYRGFIALASLLLLIGSIISGGFTTSIEVHPDSPYSYREEALEVLSPQPITLTVETNYICGTETMTEQFGSLGQMEEWLHSLPVRYQATEKVKDGYYAVVLEQDDLSPLCKEEGTFSLTSDGRLTLFQGPPENNQVIQTFFRMDTQLLESRIPEEDVGVLRQGIRIQTLEEYLSVLATFEPFATEY